MLPAKYKCVSKPLKEEKRKEKKRRKKIDEEKIWKCGNFILLLINFCPIESIIYIFVLINLIYLILLLCSLFVIPLYVRNTNTLTGRLVFIYTQLVTAGIVNCISYVLTSNIAFIILIYFKTVFLLTNTHFNHTENTRWSVKCVYYPVIYTILDD